MTLIDLARTHSRVARRQKALWFTAIPLTAFATLLAVISPARPGTGGIADLAFSGQIIAMFTGIAYAAAFADFFTAQAKLGMHELEASTPAPGALLRTARVLGAFSVVIAPSLAVLLVMGLMQTISGHPWSLPGALAVTATIVAPAALITMALSGVCGVLMPKALGRIVAVLVWFFLIFSSSVLPLPTPNGTVFSVIGDAIVAGWFGADSIYPASGPLGFDGTPLNAAISLVLQLVIIAALLLAGSSLAERTRKR
ncbi:murein hydrolase transporter LrgB [Brevibacterium luteolum]|uniref:Murein hydrolase transporter LrgB n=3 Tax=Bacteria TaxID=2 RepID=A0A849AWC7_9MICO|nr:murein hydrolase transporter LrgB [Brevibacterium luteolum]MBM7529184.1 ABC-2 type transport system permease protein [Brevibacterium luteolum]NNG80371.1 murein hydrolase transporter LrgB [Brevibacterium luteolum]